MDELPDFFLSSAGESELLSEPRACWSRARLRDQVRDDYMLIQIEPPLIGQQFGLGDKDISQLIISARLQGDTLFPVSHWPFPESCEDFVVCGGRGRINRLGTDFSHAPRSGKSC
jgi:hypothetical protein